ERGPTDRTDAAPPASLRASAPRCLAFQSAGLVSPPTLLAVAAARVPGLANGDGVPKRGCSAHTRGAGPVPALGGEDAFRQAAELSDGEEALPHPGLYGRRGHERAGPAGAGAAPPRAGVRGRDGLVG